MSIFPEKHHKSKNDKTTEISINVLLQKPTRKEPLCFIKHYNEQHRKISKNKIFLHFS